MFPCKKWLSKAEGDGQIERELLRAADLPPETAYTITTLTSDIKNASA